MIRRPCSKCGSVDFPKYRRMKSRDNGQRTESMASYCTACHAEEQKVREERRYKKKLEYNRAWRKANRDKVNASERKYYERNKDLINEKKRAKYIPKEPVEIKKHRRPQKNNSPWHTEKFDFANHPTRRL